MRILAVDYGDTRTGVALSDAQAQIPGEAFVVTEKVLSRLVARLAQEAQVRQAGLIVVGHPRNMDGTYGPRAEKAARLAELLRTKTGLPVELVDERRTTVDASRILHDNGRHGAKNKAAVDAVAATLILESCLAKLRHDAGQG